MRVYLGGTCNGSNWRKVLQSLLNKNIETIDPTIPNWTTEVEKQNDKKFSADFCVYVITPELNGFLSIANAVDMSNKYPNKTIFCYLDKFGGKTFNEHQINSLQAICDIIKKNGAKVFSSLEKIAEFLNSVNL